MQHSFDGLIWCNVQHEASVLVCDLGAAHVIVGFVFD